MTTTDPRTTALAYLGPYLGGWTGGDPDDDAYPDLPSAAIHEASHAVAMAVLGVPGLHVVVSSDVSGNVRLHPDANHSPDTHAIVLTAGAVGQGELHHALWGDDMGIGGRYAAAVGGASDLAELAPGVVLPVAEAGALAVVRVHWGAVCRLARAVLDAPGRTVTWPEVLDLLGPDVLGVGLDMGAVQAALDELATGTVERYTRGTVAGYDGP